MPGPQNWTAPTNAVDLIERLDKRIGHQERAPVVRKASDLMGPGFAPYAVLTSDWSSDACAFNGMFYSEPGAANAPDSAWWIGQVLATSAGSGIQRLWTFKNPDWPPREAVRNFEDVFGTAARVYSAWIIT